MGPGDDAGVYRLGDHFIVETVDIITPVVDDPYTFGAICAANAVSDIYAMGGAPVTALAVIGFASCDFSTGVIKRLLAGATDKLKEAGASLIGGHSIEDREIKFGLSVTGIVDRKALLTTDGASEGDILILTKPLGTGILTSAYKRGKVKNSLLKEAIASMLTLNRAASMAAVSAGAPSATDVTGFGLLGHALNLARASKVDIVIYHEEVPLMKMVKDFAMQGIVPGGASRNLEFFGRNVVFKKDLSKEERLILADPQTSGGLLIALPASRLDRFSGAAKRRKQPYWVIGEIIKGKGRVIIK